MSDLIWDSPDHRQPLGDTTRATNSSRQEIRGWKKTPSTQNTQICIKGTYLRLPHGFSSSTGKSFAPRHVSSRSHRPSPSPSRPRPQIPAHRPVTGPALIYPPPVNRPERNHNQKSIVGRPCGMSSRIPFPLSLIEIILLLLLVHLMPHPTQSKPSRCLG